MSAIARSFLFSVFASVITVSAPPCEGAFEQALNGRVIERDSGKPIADAFVIATWTHQGADPWGSRTSCVRLEIARTDEAGRYSFPLPIFGTEPEVQVFMPGFEQYDAKSSLTDEEVYAENRLVKVVPFTGPPEKRRHLYNAVSSLRTCHKDNLTDTLMPLYQAVDKEAAQLGLRGNFVRMLEWRRRTEQEEKRRQERGK